MSLNNIRIVLVNPMYGGNIGSVCRAMKNMRLRHLYLVQPQASVDWQEARTMAVSADDVLAQRKEVATLAEAIHDCVQVAGTTNREGVYRLHASPPRAWAPGFLESAAQAPVAIVFGPEKDGLNNEDLALCTQIVRIPTSPEYSSLNLAQAVLLICYELFLIKGNYQPPGEKHPECTVEQRERMIAMWEQMLWDIGFFEEQKAEHMMMAMRRIFSRGKMSESDVNILMGIARQTRWAVGKHPPAP